ncbi:membrane integrity-associated transporter subunit PqiC [Paraburkholderia sp. SIMBA_030]|uniref:PqiC family protein n=1 Tax=Paraburkholderia sp. SIMBA_030 TaxID=3085773 RepID=UPI00397B7BDE
MKLIQSRSWRAMVRMVSGIALAVLTACASPPARFYTLGTDSDSTIGNRTASPAFLIDMRPVKVPVAVARSQLVVQLNAAQVKVLEDDRWASPLPDEIRNALLAALTRQASALDVHEVAPPVYQVSVDVQRFESWPGSRALIDAVWSVRRSDDRETLTCHSIVSQPVSAGYNAVVDGHRQAIRRIAAQIAEGVREFSAASTVRPIRLAGTPGTTRKATLSCPSLAGGSDTGMNVPVLGPAR